MSDPFGRGDTELGGGVVGGRRQNKGKDGSKIDPFSLLLKTKKLPPLLQAPGFREAEAWAGGSFGGRHVQRSWLFFVHLHRDALAAFFAAALQNIASTTGFGALTETVGPSAFDIARLKSPFRHRRNLIG